MTIQRLVWRELVHRRSGFILATLTVVATVGLAIGALTHLRAGYLESTARVAALDDDIRKITKNMGFNIHILPKDQNLADFHAQDFAEKTMPVQFVQRLADSRDIMTINHLRPALIRKIDWPEGKQKIILMGVTGVVPWTHRANPAKPLADPVPPGMVDVGHELARQANLRPGGQVTLLGRPFQVHQVYPQRGSKDDITMWVDLEAAQQLLGLPGQINLIQALECNCASIDRLAEIDAEISRVLGGEVKVIELSTQAIARARAREQVKAQGQQSLAIQRYRAAWLLALVTVVGAVIVSLLMWMNVRQRREEIGILRALGLSARRIMTLFLTKAIVVGLIGAVAGYVLGFEIAVVVERSGGSSDAVVVPPGQLFVPTMMLTSWILVPMLTVLASWIPALAAARLDPARTLIEE